MSSNRRRLTRFNASTARATAEALQLEYEQIIEEGQFTTADLKLVISNVDFLMDSSNIDIFVYPLSILNKIRLLAQEELDILEGEYLPEDIHYMGESDILAVMASEYYGNVNDLVTIQRNNRVYSTDEAIKKKILKVISTDVSGQA